jgi:hypothetical protein
MRRWWRRTGCPAAPPSELTEGRWLNRSDARISMRTRAKQRGGKGGPYYRLLRLGEMAVWASDDSVLPHLESISDGAALRSFDGYEEWNRIYVLLWCLLTRGTGLKGGRTTRWRASSSLEVVAGEKWLERWSMGPFIGQESRWVPNKLLKLIPKGIEDLFDNRLGFLRIGFDGDNSLGFDSLLSSMV